MARISEAADRMMFSWEIRRRLYRHLAGQIANGIDVEIALDKHASQLARKKRPSAARIVRDAGRLMRDGKTLAEAFAKWVPLDEAGLIAAAEEAGKLPQAFKELLETKRRVRRVVTAFRNAMIRPAIYMATIYLVVWAIGKFAIPQMALAFPANRATGITAGLFWTGAMAQTLWALLPPLALLSVGWAIGYSLPRWRGRWRVVAEEYFPYSYYRDTQGYLWFSRYITLLIAGTPDVEILKQQLRYASPYIKERLRHFRRVMEDGKSFPEALLMPFGKHGKKFGFPNPDVVDDIDSFEGMGDFAERMNSVLRDWVEDLEEQTLEKAAKFGFLLEIAMYVVMGLLMYGINDISQNAHF